MDTKFSDFKQLIIFVAVVFSIGAVAAFVILSGNPVKSFVTLEAGENPSVGDFLNKERNDASIVTDLETIDFSKVGQMAFVIKAGSKEYTVQAEIKDTVAPKGEGVDHKIIAGNKLSASDFVKNIEDATEVTCSFEKEPDFLRVGREEMTVVLTDCGNNTARVNAFLEVLKDTEPPVFESAPDKYVAKGDSISYKTGVTVTDNSGGEVTLDVDSSGVDLNKEGIYSAAYTATDPSGNQATQKIKVVVGKVSEQEVERLCDDIFANILKDSMDQKQKARAIYNWIRYNVSYIRTGSETTVVLGAYDAFKKGRGDCYTFYAAAEFMLTRAGIDNKPIKRISGTATRHFWNLINVGTGWYHFDSCPTVDNLNGFMMTDTFVKEYTKTRGHNYYDYDKTTVPEIVA